LGVVYETGTRFSRA